MVVKLGQAAVPVSRDDVQLVRVQGGWGEDLLEEVKPGIGLCLSRRIDGGDSEVVACYLACPEMRILKAVAFPRFEGKTITVPFACSFSCRLPSDLSLNWGP